MRVRIPGPLRSYTNGASVVSAKGDRLDDIVTDLDRSYPGIRFRIVDEQGAVRRHIRFYVNKQPVADLGPALDMGGRSDDRVRVCPADNLLRRRRRVSIDAPHHKTL